MSPMLRYQDAGVNIDAGNALVERIKPMAKKTHIPGVLGGIGGFGALFELPTGYQQPVLVSGTDGVGTKLKLASAYNQLDTLGQDLVAMCVNDILVTGAKPLFFLDYYATGQLEIEQAATLIQGIATGCQIAQMALAGGETAEMPGLYDGTDFDLAGFAVGIVEKARILPQDIAAGDVLVALGSSGPHSNGYSLIRKILEREQNPDPVLIQRLLAPTRIYVSSLLPLIERDLIKGMAHITGGGITENLPRILPQGLLAEIQTHSWSWPAVFDWLQEKGQVPLEDMRRTFNCGVGMILVVRPQDLETICRDLATAGENAWLIGQLISAADDNTAPAVHYV